MSLHYLLDGYNIIKQIPALAPKKLRDQREALVGLIEDYRPQGSRRNTVAVVFDGQEGVWSLAIHSAVKVIFSQRESADEKIRTLVERSNEKARTVVVTDDRELSFAVRALGVKVIGVKEFLEKLRSKIMPKKIMKHQAGKETDEKRISKVLEYKITEELKEIWLKKDDCR